MSDPIPGAVEEWTEIEPSGQAGGSRWGRAGHPESGIITIKPPTTFEEYYAERQLPNQGEVLLALVPVAALREVLATQEEGAIDAWAIANANTLPELRQSFRTLLKLLAARL